MSRKIDRSRRPTASDKSLLFRSGTESRNDADRDRGLTFPVLDDVGDSLTKSFIDAPYFDEAAGSLTGQARAPGSEPVPRALR